MVEEGEDVGLFRDSFRALLLQVVRLAFLVCQDQEGLAKILEKFNNDKTSSSFKKYVGALERGVAICQRVADMCKEKEAFAQVFLLKDWRDSLARVLALLCVSTVGLLYAGQRDSLGVNGVYTWGSAVTDLVHQLKEGTTPV